MTNHDIPSRASLPMACTCAREDDWLSKWLLGAPRLVPGDYFSGGEPDFSGGVPDTLRPRIVKTTPMHAQAHIART